MTDQLIPPELMLDGYHLVVHMVSEAPGTLVMSLHESHDKRFAEPLLKANVVDEYAPLMNMLEHLAEAVLPILRQKDRRKNIGKLD